MSMLMFHPFITDDLFIAPKSIERTSDNSSYEISNNDKEFRLSLDVPGVKASDLSLTINDGVILITGSRRSAISEGKTSKKARFSKSFAVDQQTVDLSKLTANLADGVLLVSAPKKPRPEPRTILITTNHTIGVDNGDKDHDQLKEKAIVAKASDAGEANQENKAHEVTTKTG